MIINVSAFGKQLIVPGQPGAFERWAETRIVSLYSYLNRVVRNRTLGRAGQGRLPQMIVSFVREEELSWLFRW
jgi:hypothetical protein